MLGSARELPWCEQCTLHSFKNPSTTYTDRVLAQLHLPVVPSIGRMQEGIVRH
jgi:hypothetical protein